MFSPCSLSPVRSPSSISTNDRLGTSAGDAMVPYRRPSTGPPPTSSSTAVKAISTILARSSSSRRRHRRHSCTQWRANTYNGTDDYPGSVDLIDDDDGRLSEAGAKLSPAPSTTILCLREAMRSLACPQMQLCIGAGSGVGGGSVGALSAPASNSVSTLSVAIIGGACGHGGQHDQQQQKQQQRRRSSGGSGAGGVKHSSISPHTSPKHQPAPAIGLLTADAYGGSSTGSATTTTTTRSASVCYPPIVSQQQQTSRRCSNTTKSGRLERSNSLIAGRGGAMLAFMPDLNPQQVANLRRTWKHINTKGLYDIIRRSFRKVESAHSSVAKAFRQTGTGDGSSSSAAALAENCAAAGGTSGRVALPPQTKFCGVMEHSKYFMMLLNRIIDGDNNQEDLVRELKQIGARHFIVYKRFGVGVTEIERSGEALAESLFKLDGIRQSKEATKVWRVLIAKIVDHIVTGFTGELRSQRRRTSSALLSSAAGALATPLFEHQFAKRNSVPNPHKTFARAATASNEEYDEEQGIPSSTVSPSHTVASASHLSANYNIHQLQQSASSGDCFLRAELAGVVRRLSNL